MSVDTLWKCERLEALLECILRVGAFVDVAMRLLVGVAQSVLCQVLTYPFNDEVHRVRRHVFNQIEVRNVLERGQAV